MSLLIVNLLCAVLGLWIGERKGEAAGGFLMGLLLGVLGLLIVVIWKGKQLRACPDCAEQIQPTAAVCRYCGYRITG